MLYDLIQQVFLGFFEGIEGLVAKGQEKKLNLKSYTTVLIIWCNNSQQQKELKQVLR